MALEKAHIVPGVMIRLHQKGKLELVQALCGKIWSPKVYEDDLPQEHIPCAKCQKRLRLLNA